jgi:hypothetical protein
MSYRAGFRFVAWQATAEYFPGQSPRCPLPEGWSEIEVNEIGSIQSNCRHGVVLCIARARSSSSDRIAAFSFSTCLTLVGRPVRDGNGWPLSRNAMCSRYTNLSLVPTSRRSSARTALRSQPPNSHQLASPHAGFMPLPGRGQVPFIGSPSVRAWR